MTLNFIKMHGCGNDFMIIDLRMQQFDTGLIRQLADYKKAVGFDQLLLINHSEAADVAMQIFNNDGSEASACGNGSRCVAKLLLEETNKPRITIATINRILEAKWQNELVSVNMGRAKILEQDILFGQLHGSLVDVGNPHIIINDAEKLDIFSYGPQIEHDPRFPNKVNVDFAQIINRDLVDLRVWERGAGATHACGSGACATFFYLYRQAMINSNAVIRQAGGNLHLAIENDEIFMAGDACISYRGRIE